MNKRISKGRTPLVAALVLSLMVSFSVFSYYPKTSLRVYAANYDLPIGDHEGAASEGSFRTAQSDYNPAQSRIKNSANTPVVDHGYYYGKLSTPEKRDLYDAIFIGCDSSRRLKKGDSLPSYTSEAAVVKKGGYLFYTGTSSRSNYYFNDKDTQEAGTVVNEAIEALCYDHLANVEYYMCEWNIYEFETNGIYKDYIIMQETTNDDYAAIDKEIVNKAKEYAGTVRNLGLIRKNSKAVTVLNVHDWYTKQLEYGRAQQINKGYFNLCHTAYGALCQKKAVCDGYSMGYALILKELGISARVVTGYVYLANGDKGGHAWNMVEIDGSWYEEDTTWADTKGTGGANFIEHSYYNRTTAEYTAGINGNKHLREVPYTGRVMDIATGTTYTYEATLKIAATPDIDDDNDDNGGSGSGDNGGSGSGDNGGSSSGDNGGSGSGDNGGSGSGDNGGSGSGDNGGSSSGSGSGDNGGSSSGSGSGDNGGSGSGSGSGDNGGSSSGSGSGDNGGSSSGSGSEDNGGSGSGSGSGDNGGSSSGNQSGGGTSNGGNSQTVTEDTESPAKVDIENATATSQSVNCKINSDGAVSISGIVDKKSTSVVIPNTVTIEGKEYPVTKIDAGAFKGNKKLKKITGGANIISIGKDAFAGCKNLRSVDLSGADIKTIGAKAFNGCGNLKNIKLNGDYLKKVGSKAFNKLYKNVKITIFAKSQKAYKNIVAKVTKAGGNKAKFKYKKSLGIKYT
ncbi:leucine-rich repeat protein [Butyrivibrio sp. JL13D10]|uniref:leucine-rich repeat protein n=1 Tax=Butyrivibrio sp. JL13D10 TaxID=3236815 RepID=UPI0038B516D4